MSSVLRYLGQGAVYLMIAALLGLFSNAPRYLQFGPEQAAITVSMVHGATRKEECRRLTAEELAKLAPNMRKPMLCQRERLPVWLAIEIDGEVLLEASLPAAGLSKDGPSQFHRRFTVESGKRRLSLKLRDTARSEGYDYVFEREVELEPRQSLAVDFKPEYGGFLLH